MTQVDPKRIWECLPCPSIVKPAVNDAGGGSAQGKCKLVSAGQAICAAHISLHWREVGILLQQHQRSGCQLAHSVADVRGGQTQRFGLWRHAELHSADLVICQGRRHASELGVLWICVHALHSGDVLMHQTTHTHTQLGGPWMVCGSLLPPLLWIPARLGDSWSDGSVVSPLRQHV